MSLAKSPPPTTSPILKNYDPRPDSVQQYLSILSRCLFDASTSFATEAAIWREPGKRSSSATDRRISSIRSDGAGASARSTTRKITDRIPDVLGWLLCPSGNCPDPDCTSLSALLSWYAPSGDQSAPIERSFGSAAEKLRIDMSGNVNYPQTGQIIKAFESALGKRVLSSERGKAEIETLRGMSQDRTVCADTAYKSLAEAAKLCEKLKRGLQDAVGSAASESEEESWMANGKSHDALRRYVAGPGSALLVDLCCASIRIDAGLDSLDQAWSVSRMKGSRRRIKGAL